MSTKAIDEKQSITVLDKIYSSSLKGVGGSSPVKQVSAEYLQSAHGDVQKAANEFVNWQLAKCATTGFLTNIGGLITLPVSIPLDVCGVLYVQLRMIMVIADLGGYNVNSDAVKSYVYACLVGLSVADIAKCAGIQVANKLTVNAVKRIPGEAIKKINQAVGFRLVTKAGTKGTINITKAVPIVGGVVGGTVDFVSTKVVAKRAIEMFLK